MKFTEFLEENLLQEALNNPKEYYFTDDTKIPTDAYGAFDVDGFHYIMKLQQCKVQGLYILEVGRTTTNGGKVQWMKFHKPNHILPVLATTMHFSQACAALLGANIKGVAIRYRNNTAKDLERAASLTERILKRSYLKSFSVMKVTQPEVMTTDTKSAYKAWRHVFISKKGVDASTVFKGSYYNKYDISAKDGIPNEVLGELQPKKVEKAVKTLKPSKKYSFGKYDVETPTDDDLIGTVEKIKNQKKEAEPKSKAKTVVLPKTGAKPSTKAAVIKLMSPFSSMVTTLEKKGFDQKKLNWNNLQFQISKCSEKEKLVLKSMGLLGAIKSTDQQRWIKVMKAVASPTLEVGTSTAVKNVKEFMAGDSELPQDEGKTYKFEELTATMPGSGTGVVKIPKNGGSWISNQDHQKVAGHIYKDLQFEEKLQKTPGFSNLVSYSGSAYESYNEPLRDVVSKLLSGSPMTKSEIEMVTKPTAKIAKLAKMFDKIGPMPESLWVYRGTVLPKSVKDKVDVGYQYVDPAFLSTSTKPGTSFGVDKMRIFIPKGSRVLPVLYHSKHSTEYEILLPPASVIEVISVDENSTRLFMQGVFMGSPFKSIAAALKKQLTMSEDYDTMIRLKGFIETLEEELEHEMSEEKETKNYSPEGKFGGNFDSETSELISKALKEGKLKLDTKKK